MYFVSLFPHVLQDLNVLQANAWVYWQAIENSEVGNFWGLIQARPVSSQHCMLTRGSTGNAEHASMAPLSIAWQAVPRPAQVMPLYTTS